MVDKIQKNPPVINPMESEGLIILGIEPNYAN
jgi:hypothetical protein